MLSNLLSTVLVELNQYIHQSDAQPAGSPEAAVWGNIALRDDSTLSSELENMLVMTLVNVEEESTLKNSHSFARPVGAGVSYSPPPVFLNLYLLFSANYRNYETALTRLGQVIAFFQRKNTFTSLNSPSGNIPVTSDASLTLSLLSLSMEQLNHLWGSLGGKQLPFVIFCGRLLEVKDVRPTASGGRIEQVSIVGHGAVS
jgi:hypothetical protein